MKEPCPDCNKPGYIAVIPIKGDGKCSNCSGTGQTVEEAMVEVFTTLHEDCPDCNGTGKCQTCDGTGWIDD